MGETTCEWCGEAFTYYPSNSAGRFCSRDCHSAFTRSDENPRKVELECTNCGTAYYKLPSNINDGRQFCSRDCLGEYRREPDNPGTGTCSECGESFREKAALAEHFKEAHFDGRVTSDAQCPTCGRQFEDRRGMRIHHNSVHGKSLVPTVTRSCKHCGTKFAVKERDLQFHECDFCSQRCHYEYGKGGKGTERVRRILTDSGEHWEEIAYEVREAAGGECEMCGASTPTHGRPGLQTHHIIPLRCGGTHADWNLIALCPECHGKAEAKANELFNRYLWGESAWLTDRPRDKKGRFLPIGTST